MQQTKVEMVAHSLFIAQVVHFLALHLLQDMDGREWQDEIYSTHH